MSEYRSTAAPRKGRITTNSKKHVQVEYSDLDGLAIFEGDIVLGTVAEIEAVSSKPDVQSLSPMGVAITGQKFRWPGGKIPYRIDPNLTNQERVTGAIKHWESNTSIRFLALTGANLNQHSDRILFASQGGCWSMVGRAGGEQVISLGDGCSLGNAIHEIGHAVGLWHEQSREDRDMNVTINWQNITAGNEHNFNQHITDGDDIGAYDFGSIMHYSATAFSKNGQPTIVTKNGAPIGQREGLSKGDLEAVKTIYKGI